MAKNEELILKKSEDTERLEKDMEELEDQK